MTALPPNYDVTYSGTTTATSRHMAQAPATPAHERHIVWYACRTVFSEHFALHHVSKADEHVSKADEHVSKADEHVSKKTRRRGGLLNIGVRGY